MTIISRLSLFLTCSFNATPATLAAPTQEHIGRWIINCPASALCQMRFAKPFLDKAGVTADLEIPAPGTTLVPDLGLCGVLGETLMAAGCFNDLADMQGRLARSMGK
jgi:hypothetical protein